MAEWDQEVVRQSYEDEEEPDQAKQQSGDRDEQPEEDLEPSPSESSIPQRLLRMLSIHDGGPQDSDGTAFHKHCCAAGKKGGQGQCWCRSDTELLAHWPSDTCQPMCSQCAANVHCDSATRRSDALHHLHRVER